jgi:hypothetical protein
MDLGLLALRPIAAIVVAVTASRAFFLAFLWCARKSILDSLTLSRWRAYTNPDEITRD